MIMKFLILGNNGVEKLSSMIKIIENKLCIKAIVNFKPMQLGDIKKTYADINKAEKMLNYKPKTKFENGMEEFINWFYQYYNS